MGSNHLFEVSLQQNYRFNAHIRWGHHPGRIKITLYYLWRALQKTVVKMALVLFVLLYKFKLKIKIVVETVGCHRCVSNRKVCFIHFECSSGVLKVLHPYNRNITNKDRSLQ